MEVNAKITNIDLKYIESLPPVHGHPTYLLIVSEQSSTATSARTTRENYTSAYHMALTPQ